MSLWGSAGVLLLALLGVSYVVQSDAARTEVAWAQWKCWNVWVPLSTWSQGFTSPCGLFIWCPQDRLLTRQLRVPKSTKAVSTKPFNAYILNFQKITFSFLLFIQSGHRPAELEGGRELHQGSNIRRHGLLEAMSWSLGTMFPFYLWENVGLES